MTPQPWICPRCAAVNAPHVNQCPCVPAQATPVPPFIPTVWWPIPASKLWWDDPSWGSSYIITTGISDATYLTIGDQTK